MSARWILILLILPAVVGEFGCSRTAQPGDDGYRYNLAGRYASDMKVHETRYTGSMQLSTRPGGAVSGRMILTAPIGIIGELFGTVTGDSINFGGPYRTPDCTGVLRGRGRITAGGGSASGSVYIDDGCVGPMAGSFRLER